MGENSANSGYTVADFQRYRDGLMTAREQHVFEKKCMEDPLIGDAYEGYLLLANNDVRAEPSVIRLEERLHNRISRKSEDRSVIWYYTSAAMLLVAYGISWIFFVRNDSSEPGHTGMTSETEVSAAVENDVRPEPGKVLSTSPPSKQRDGKRQTEILSESADTIQIAVIDLDQSHLAHNEQVVTVEAQSPPPSFQRFGVKANSEKGITGKVLHAREPMPGVVITNDSNAVMSDQDDRFSLPGKPGDSLLLSLIGFQLRKVPVVTSDLGTLQLEPDTHTVSGAINNGLGKSAGEIKSNDSGRITPERVLAQPKGGWDAYNQYLKENAKGGTGEGVVEISFSISESGVLSNFRTKGSTGLFEAAIRIVSEGPAWRPASQHGVNYTDKVHFSIHFIRR